MPKTISILLISFITIFIVLGLINQISSALTASSRLDQAVDEVSKLQDQNRVLKDRLEKVKQYQYIEEVARNKLQMARPDETVIIVADNRMSNLMNPPKEEIPPKPSNWQGWLKLFTH